MKNREWMLQSKETRRKYDKATWVPLRVSCTEEQGDITALGCVSEFFGCGSVAFSPEQKQVAEKLSWNDIGISNSTEPYAYEDGYYSSVEEYEYNDKAPIGINLVFQQIQPITGIRKWIVNPDLIIALGLIQDGANWVRPEENFTVVIKESFDDEGNHISIKIKREFLIDYLAARNLSLRLSYYRQRVKNVESLESSPYSGLENSKEERDGGRFELLIRDLEDVYGGGWFGMRVWRTDIDEEEDAPVMGEESDDNVETESSQGYIKGYPGVRVESEFFRDEWIEHQGLSVRVRGDKDPNLPSFIIETDGSRMASSMLNNEDIGRWLWFRPSVINEFLNYQGFSLEWHTAETGSLRSPSGYGIHFGVNSSSLVSVYAYDIARLASWEQHIWSSYNVVPEGKVSFELLMSQVEAKPATTRAAEVLLLECMKLLEISFKKYRDIDLFSSEINEASYFKQINRFSCIDQASLLTLAKELIRVFSERLNKDQLRELSNHKDKKTLGSNKLLESILADKVGTAKAREVFGVIAGVYDMRIGDAHLASSKVDSALQLAGINDSQSFLKQAEQLIKNFGESIWRVGKLLFDTEK